jgi:RimJ/RimL family protein N-acetyltransferase
LVLDVLTINHRAQALYQRLGMTESAGTADGDGDGDGDGEITMRYAGQAGKPEGT